MSTSVFDALNILRNVKRKLKDIGPKNNWKFQKQKQIVPPVKHPNEVTSLYTPKIIKLSFLASKL